MYEYLILFLCVNVDISIFHLQNGKDGLLSISNFFYLKLNSIIQLQYELLATNTPFRSKKKVMIIQFSNYLQKSSYEVTSKIDRPDRKCLSMIISSINLCDVGLYTIVLSPYYYCTRP